MDQIIDRLFGHPTTYVVGGLVFGFWLIGEVSRRFEPSAETQRRIEAKKLDELIMLIKSQNDQIEELRRMIDDE